MTSYLLGDEMVCPRCLAGVESSEHHYECVLPAEQKALEETAHQPLLTENEFHAISKAFYDKPSEDPTRYQDGFSILLGVVGSIAVGGGSGEWASHEATQALRRVMARVVRGEMDAEVNRHGA